MRFLDVLVDEELRSEAHKALDEFIPLLPPAAPVWGDFPVETSQITGLREIAEQQPLAVARFANNQRDKAQTKGSERSQRAADFWQLVANLYRRPDSQKDRWSLSQMAEGLLETHPEWSFTRDDWLAKLIPPFYLHFCAHYLGSRPPKPKGNR